MYRFATAFAAIALLHVGLAEAQQRGPNGGLLGGSSGGHQAELVTTPTEATVYILEKGKVHTTDGAKLRLVVLQGGKTKTIELVDQQGKRLTAKLDSPLETGTVVVLSGKDKHGDVISARYVIK